MPSIRCKRACTRPSITRGNTLMVTCIQILDRHVLRKAQFSPLLSGRKAAALVDRPMLRRSSLVHEGVCLQYPIRAEFQGENQHAIFLFYLVADHRTRADSCVPTFRPM